MEDFIFVPAVIGVGILVLTAVRRALPLELRNWAMFTWLAHVGASVGQILLYKYFYAGGDLLTYGYLSVPISEALHSDLRTFLPDVVNLFLQRPHNLPFLVVGEESTGTMHAVVIMLFYLLGNSLYASSLAVAIAAFASKFLVFQSLKPFVSPARATELFWATMMVPSFVFWTSTLLKEPIASIAMGPAIYGLTDSFVAARRFAPWSR